MNSEKVEGFLESSRFAVLLHDEEQILTVNILHTTMQQEISSHYVSISVFMHFHGHVQCAEKSQGHGAKANTVSISHPPSDANDQRDAKGMKHRMISRL